ncbi:RNA 2',3'-cyclic phosphodiesterase [uncultured Draconibacterium sp.]|uniref:RNA 2',3'-cyclic phosphodiesterase n=1 Tax=uncultured Draconibacterium sp. TaxID=1573823 RepID=UPI0032600384
MRNKIRTFVAIKIEPNAQVLDLLQGLMQVFVKDRINWVNPAGLHLTLRFIGNTNREQLYKLVDRLETAVSLHNSFNIKVVGTACFRRKNKPGVVFAKIEAPHTLQLLQQSIEKEIVACGFYEEQKLFRPHITLGRVKSVRNNTQFCSIIEKMPDKIYQEIEVKELVLFQSILKPTGPEYRPVQIFSLL